MRQLNNQYIVKLYEVFETFDQVILCMEYINGKSLYDYIKEQEEKRLKEQEAKRIFIQILGGISYCHSKCVSHRDIKLENILLDENNNVKIIDFGFSTIMSKDSKNKLYCGTLSYMAPEIFSGKEYKGQAADIWALGILLYAMLCGKFPFKGTNETEMRQALIQNQFNFPNYLSVHTKSLLSRLLRLDPNCRPTAEQILLDSWLTPPKLSVELSGSFKHPKVPNSTCTLKYNHTDIKELCKCTTQNNSCKKQLKLCQYENLLKNSAKKNPQEKILKTILERNPNLSTKKLHDKSYSYLICRMINQRRKSDPMAVSNKNLQSRLKTGRTITMF